MVLVGELWKHKDMPWLRLRVKELNPVDLDRNPQNPMALLEVEGSSDGHINGVQVEFDSYYLVRNYILIESELGESTWQL